MRSVGTIDLKDLHLDPDNPRLPEYLKERGEAEILAHLYKTAALEELAESIRTNGFFSSEPVIVSGPEDNGKRIVLEGNRRLATVLILAQDPRAIAADLAFSTASSAAPIDIQALPAVEVDDDDEFNAYLGYRHISGLRVWGAGEKARYLWAEIRRIAPDAGDEAFYRLGRTVGSNARGVRSAYLAYEVLQHARREGIDEQLVSFVLSERFGVWVRLLGTKNVPSYIGLAESALTLSAVDASIAGVNIRALGEVLEDLRPAPGRKNALLADSRQVTNYSDVLGNEVARNLLRTSGNLELAGAVADRPDIDSQLQAVSDQLRVITEYVTSDGDITQTTGELASRVVKSARVMAAAIAAFAEDAAE